MQEADKKSNSPKKGRHRHCAKGGDDSQETNAPENEKEVKKGEEDEGDWPPSLRRYLKRAFETCAKRQGSRIQLQLEKALHRMVTDAMAENRMQTTDWDKEPLPR